MGMSPSPTGNVRPTVFREPEPERSEYPAVQALLDTVAPLAAKTAETNRRWFAEARARMQIDRKTTPQLVIESLARRDVDQETREWYASHGIGI